MLPRNVQVKGSWDTVEAEVLYLKILSFLQQADPAIRVIEQVLVNDQNEQWLAMVKYSDGSYGAVEGDGTTIVRQTASQTLSERLLDVDPGFTFDGAVEPREL